MKASTKIALVNIVVILLYTIATRVTGISGSEGEGIMLTNMVPVTLQILANLILSLIFFSTRHKELGKTFLLSTGIVLLVGFSTCMGSAAL